MNWKKTEEIYLREGYKLPLPPESRERYPLGTLIYNKKQEQLDFERWEMRVKERNSQTGEWVYRQRIGDPTVYPIVTVKQLKRIRAPDGKQYLKSLKELKGIDNNGNLRSTTIQDHEVFIMPEFVRERRRRRENPNEDELVIVEAQENQRVYTQPFSAEAVDQLLEGQQQVRRISFSVAEETEEGAVAPREVRNLEDFKHKDFDELYFPIPSPQEHAAGTGTKATAAARR